jgi:cell wall-associated NlpC family hydrolase
MLPLTLTLVLSVLALLAPQPAAAVTIAEKRAEAQQVAGQLAALDNQLGDLQERFRYSVLRYRELDGHVKKLTGDLHAQELALDVAQKRLYRHAVSVYEHGSTDSGLLHLARAKSFSDFLDRLDTVRLVNQQDVDILTRIKTLRRAVIKRRAELKEARAEQAKIVAVRKKTRDQMAKKVAKKQSILNGITAELRQMVAAEQAAARERAIAAARAAAEQYLANGGGGGGGGGVSPGVDLGAAMAGAGIAPPPGGWSSDAVRSAMAQLGTPYVWAGSAPGGFDCSGLISYAYGKAGKALPHSSYALWNSGTHVSRDQLQEGDLVFFSGLGHVGMYIGGGKFVHAPHTGDVVKVSSLNDRYGRGSYVGAVRVR